MIESPVSEIRLIATFISSSLLISKPLRMATVSGPLFADERAAITAQRRVSEGVRFAFWRISMPFSKVSASVVFPV